jgi:hypothetical protein
MPDLRVTRDGMAHMAKDKLSTAQLGRAIDLASAGDWEGAHRIVQSDENGDIANWIHAVLHRIEGDLDNARYWYRQALRPYDPSLSAEQELLIIRLQLGG